MPTVQRMGDYSFYRVTITAGLADAPPEMTITVDASQGEPIVRGVSYHGGGEPVSAMSVWGEVDVDRLASGLPKYVTAKQLDEDEPTPEPPASQGPAWEKKRCPECHRMVAVSSISHLFNRHDTKPHGGDRCPKSGKPAIEATPKRRGGVKGEPRRNYRPAPPEVLRLLAEKYNGSPKALAEGEGVPHHTASSWVERARRRERRARLADPPTQEPDEPQPEQATTRRRGRAVDFPVYDPFAESEDPPAAT